MSCKYCEHESLAYVHRKDEQGRDWYDKVAETIPFDDDSPADAEPMISWWVTPDVLDWANNLPRLCVSAYDSDGEETCISVPIRFCPMCGRELPKARPAVIEED
jgi:hypothetical protein